MGVWNGQETGSPLLLSQIPQYPGRRHQRHAASVDQRELPYVNIYNEPYGPTVEPIWDANGSGYP